jgi:hypothetical protein
MFIVFSFPHAGTKTKYNDDAGDLQGKVEKVHIKKSPQPGEQSTGDNQKTSRDKQLY